MRQLPRFVSALFAVALLLLTASCTSVPGEISSAVTGHPMLKVVEQFSAPGIPFRGPDEAPFIPRGWPEPATTVNRIGRGLAEHPMLYAGEGYNTLFVVNQGKVIWSYSAGPEGEIDDVWMMSNGHVLFARQFHVEEITPQKQVVWSYDPPPGTEVHSCQPIGLDKVLLVQNGLPPKLMVINKQTGAIELEHALPAASLTDPKTIHPQFRRIRVTAAGTYLAPFLKMDQVVEYDQAFNPIWTYKISTPWSAVRLHNGNTLITDEHDKLVREVSREGRTVWEFKQSDCPPDLVLHNLQTADRLADGNTVIFSSTGGTKPAERPGIIQALEVTPDKKIVWVLQDWKNLGPATTAQFLDEPGLPEKPGELQH